MFQWVDNQADRVGAADMSDLLETADEYLDTVDMLCAGSHGWS